MTFATFKLIKRPPVANLQIKRIRDETVKAIQPVLKQYVSERERVTNYFTVKPQYEAKVNVRTTGVQVLVLLKNGKAKVRGGVTLATLLEWLFVTGTKAHLIRAKKAGGRLAFRGRGGEMVFRFSVRHPGSRPDPALDIVDRKLEGPLRTAMFRGVDNAFRKR